MTEKKMVREEGWAVWLMAFLFRDCGVGNFSYFEFLNGPIVILYGYHSLSSIKIWARLFCFKIYRVEILPLNFFVLFVNNTYCILGLQSDEFWSIFFRETVFWKEGFHLFFAGDCPNKCSIPADVNSIPCFSGAFVQHQ